MGIKIVLSPRLIAIQSGHRAGTDCGIGHACYMNKLSSCRVARYVRTCVQSSTCMGRQDAIMIAWKTMTIG